MSKSTNKKTKFEPDLINNPNIITDDIESIISERFARYSKYVIQDRAIPDVRDGLKPVQRRILFAMYKAGLTSGSSEKTSAKIAGDVMGKYHPHGDSSIYDAMVRMSQNFKTNALLIDMYGNKGSVDGDPAAAYRYTKSKLSRYAEFLLQDINKKTISMQPNFDDTCFEPTILPSRLPNILINGAMGISAGYATEIPPHNIKEVVHAVVYRINNPNCSLDDILNIIQGPDFPTGGIIINKENLTSIYKTGSGKIFISSKIEINTQNNTLVVTQIPYEVNKAQTVKKMNEVYVNHNIEGVLEIKDESAKDNIKIVVYLKPNANFEQIRDFFLKYTDLQISYNYNMVVICDRRPIKLGLLEILDAYIKHQKNVVLNRTQAEISTATERLKIVKGLIKMIPITDAVIQTIRSSRNKQDAIVNLHLEYNFEEFEAEAIVNLQLYKLTSQDIYALQKEAVELTDRIKSLNKIIESEVILISTIQNELLKALDILGKIEEFSMERKTNFDDIDINTIKKVEVNEITVKEEVIVSVTSDYYVKVLPVKAYQSTLDKGKDGDPIIFTFNLYNTSTLLFFTSEGNYAYIPVKEIKDSKLTNIGINVRTLRPIPDNDKLIACIGINDFSEKAHVLITTKQGWIKRTLIECFEAERIGSLLRATKLKDGDEVVSVSMTNKPSNVVVMSNRFINSYSALEISEMGIPAVGVIAIIFNSKIKKAIDLKKEVEDVIRALYVDKSSIILISTDKMIYQLTYTKFEQSKRSKVSISIEELIPNFKEKKPTFTGICVYNKNERDNYLLIKYSSIKECKKLDSLSFPYKLDNITEIDIVKRVNGE